MEDKSPDSVWVMFQPESHASSFFFRMASGRSAVGGVSERKVLHNGIRKGLSECCYFESPASLLLVYERIVYTQPGDKGSNSETKNTFQAWLHTSLGGGLNWGLSGIVNWVTFSS